jgi:hapalindole biogenesis HpiC1 cyclase-like protein
LLPDTTYTLSVDVGHRLDGLETGYSIGLDAGSTALGAFTGSNSTITPGTFANEVFTYTTGSTVTPGDLTIVLGSVFVQSNFDNVRLTTASGSGVSVPEPSDVLLLVMGLGCLALFRRSSRKGHLTSPAP